MSENKQEQSQVPNAEIPNEPSPESNESTPKIKKVEISFRKGFSINVLETTLRDLEEAQRMTSRSNKRTPFREVVSFFIDLGAIMFTQMKVDALNRNKKVIEKKEVNNTGDERFDDF